MTTQNDSVARDPRKLVQALRRKYVPPSVCNAAADALEAALNERDELNIRISNQLELVQQYGSEADDAQGDLARVQNHLKAMAAERLILQDDVARLRAENQRLREEQDRVHLYDFDNIRTNLHLLDPQARKDMAACLDQIGYLHIENGQLEHRIDQLQAENERLRAALESIQIHDEIGSPAQKTADAALKVIRGLRP